MSNITPEQCFYYKITSILDHILDFLGPKKSAHVCDLHTKHVTTILLLNYNWQSVNGEAV